MLAKYSAILGWKRKGPTNLEIAVKITVCTFFTAGRQWPKCETAVRTGLRC